MSSLRNKTCITCDHCSDRNNPYGTHKCRRLGFAMEDGEAREHHGCILWAPDEWHPETQARNTKKGTTP